MTLEEDKAHYWWLEQYYFHRLGGFIANIKNIACLYIAELYFSLEEIENYTMFLRYAYSEIPFDELDHPDFEPLFKARARLPILEALSNNFVQDPTEENQALLEKSCQNFYRRGEEYRDILIELGIKIGSEDPNFMNQFHHPIIDMGSFTFRCNI